MSGPHETGPKKAVVRPTSPSARRSLKQTVQSVVVHAQPVGDQAQGHGVENAAQQEPDAAGGGDQNPVVVGCAPRRQGPQNGALHLDQLAAPGIGVACSLVHEPVVVRQFVEVAGSAHSRADPSAALR